MSAAPALPPTVDRRSDTARIDEARQFFRTLFGDLPDGLLVALWRKSPREMLTTCFSDLHRIGESIVGLSKDFDLYVHCGLSSGEIPQKKRLEAANAAGIVALWADIDVAGEGHSKAGLPPSIEAALEAVRAATTIAGVEYAPTVTVRTGGGAHLWWALAEPWAFGGDDDRQRAAVLVWRWQELLRVEFERRKWTFDSTHDLARVLRIPGSLNRKIPGAERPVELYEIEPRRRYQPSALEEALDEAGIAKEMPRSKLRRAPEAAIDAGELGEEDLARLEALKANDAKFAGLWNGGHEGYPSDSEADLAFCNLLRLNLGFDPGQLRAAMIASGRDRKKLRTHPTYLRDTIAKALELEPRAVQQATGEGASLLDRLNALEIFEGSGFKWRRFERRGPRTFGYAVRLEDAEPRPERRVIWETSQVLATFGKSQSVLMRDLDVFILTPKPSKIRALWEPAVQLIVALASRDKIGSDAQETELADLLPKAFAAAGEPVARNNADFAEIVERCKGFQRDPYRERRGLPGEVPPSVFIFEGALWIHSPSLRSWLSLPAVENLGMKRADFNHELNVLGFTYLQKFEKVADKVATKADLWRGPLSALGTEEDSAREKLERLALGEGRQ